MKPGDKVWIFYNDEIIQVEYVEILGGRVLCDPDKRYPNLVFWDADEWPHFESREALCEYYRKIFE